MRDALEGADKIASIQDFGQMARADTWKANGTSNSSAHLCALFQWDLRILPDGKRADRSGGELKFAENYLQNVRVCATLSISLRTWVVPARFIPVVPFTPSLFSHREETLWRSATSQFSIPQPKLSLTVLKPLGASPFTPCPMPMPAKFLKMLKR